MLYPLPHKTSIAPAINFIHVPETKVQLTITEPEHLIILHHTANRSFYQINSETSFGSIHSFDQLRSIKKRRTEERREQRKQLKEAKLNVRSQARLARNIIITPKFD